MQEILNKILQMLGKADEFGKKMRSRQIEKLKPTISPFGTAYGSFFERMIAATIDLFIITLFLSPVLKQANNMHEFIANSLAQTIIGAVYCLTFWSFFSATPGKIILRLQIVDAKTGAIIKTSQAVKRFIAYIPSLGFFALGVFSISWNKQRRGWHDFIAGTAVCKKTRKVSNQLSTKE